MNLVAAYGLLAQALVFGALVTLLPLGPLRQRAALAATTAALLAGIAPALHGVFGAPSLTLLQLAIWQLAGRDSLLPDFRPALGLLVFAGLFYGTALGWGPVDPYALGYQPWALLAALIPVAAALWWRRQEMALLILSVDLLAYAAGLFANLWDALLDPLLVLLALFVVGRQGIETLLARRRAARAH